MLHGLIGDPRMFRERIRELEQQNAALVEQNDNMHDSLEWLTNLICGVGKDHPEKITNQEWQDAVENSKQALAQVETTKKKE